MACNIIGFQVGFSWSDVKIFTVLALKDGSTMALQSVTMYFGFEFGRAEKYSLLPQNIISMSFVAIMRGNLSKK